MRRTLFALVFVVVSTTGSRVSYAESTNRNEVRSRIAAGGWYVLWGVTINDAEYAKFAVAVYSGSVTEYFSDLLDRNIAKFKSEATMRTEDFLLGEIRRAFKTGQVIRTGRKLALKAGIATYNRWKNVSAHLPTGSLERYKVYGPTILGRETWTWGWRPEMKLTERHIPLPNNHQPFVAFRLTDRQQTRGVDNRTSDDRARETTRITLVNETSYTITHDVDHGDGRGFRTRWTLARGAAVRHYGKRGNTFRVSWDGDLRPGPQQRTVPVPPNGRYRFKKYGNNATTGPGQYIDLVRGEIRFENRTPNIIHYRLDDHRFNVAARRSAWHPVRPSSDLRQIRFDHDLRTNRNRTRSLRLAPGIYDFRLAGGGQFLELAGN